MKHCNKIKKKHAEIQMILCPKSTAVHSCHKIESAHLWIYGYKYTWYSDPHMLLSAWYFDIGGGFFTHMIRGSDFRFMWHCDLLHL